MEKYSHKRLLVCFREKKDVGGKTNLLPKKKGPSDHSDPIVVCSSGKEDLDTLEDDGVGWVGSLRWKGQDSGSCILALRGSKKSFCHCSGKERERERDPLLVLLRVLRTYIGQDRMCQLKS